MNTCPNGHTSSEPDYCDTCGMAIGGSAPTPAPVAAASPSANKCPQCDGNITGGDRYCETCGYDTVEGHANNNPGPVVASEGNVSAPAGEGPVWTASVVADRDWYEACGSGVEFPAVAPERRFELTGDMIRIGRRSASKGILPEMDLSAAPLDPGVSHVQAILERDGDSWKLIDPGSTNGTSIDGSTTAVAIMTPVPVQDGTRIHVGAWTTITLHAPAS